MQPITYDNLRNTMQRVEEALAAGGALPPPPMPEATELHVLQITSASQTSARYPATLYARDADAETFTAYTADDCWARGLNGEALSLGVYYWAKVEGPRAADGKLIYSVVGIVGSDSGFSGCSVNDQTHIASISSGATSAIDWNSEDFDTDNYHSTSSNKNRLTAPTSGKYHVTANVEVQYNGSLDTEAGGLARLGIRFNGGSTFLACQGGRFIKDPTASSPTENYYLTLNCSLTWLIGAAEYVDAAVRWDGTSNVAVATGLYTRSSFSIFKI